jgi:CubicO group peptidase (beta-lactamase class C family)
MKNSLLRTVPGDLFPLLVLFAAPVAAALPPGADWPAGTPESEGFDPAKLESLWTDLLRHGTEGFLVIRHDHIVFEHYAEGWSRTKPHGTASLAKALVGGTSLMFAMEDGRIRPDDLASRFIPHWTNDPVKSRIQVRHLATHTSGIEDAELDEIPHERLPGWKGEFWQRLPPPRDPFTLGRDVAPVLDPPGTKARYSNPGMGMLAYCVTASLRSGTNADLRSLLQNRLLDPLGVPRNEWSIGYGKPSRVEGMDLYGNWGGGAFSANAAARIGRLMMRGGDWDGRRLLSERVVRTATAHVGLPNHSGLAWWVNREADGKPVWPDAPGDAFWGSGAGHQFLFVVPSLDLIVVRNGNQLDNKLGHNEALEKHVVVPLLAALAKPAASVLPPSPVIKQIIWAPKETIMHRAQGSDNWPLTWADDDALYTAYGDGNGFEPFVPEKLGLGLARVCGGPADFVGENLRAPTLEQRGQGAAGRKASGILCVESEVDERRWGNALPCVFQRRHIFCAQSGTGFDGRLKPRQDQPRCNRCLPRLRGRARWRPATWSCPSTPTTSASRSAARSCRGSTCWPRWWRRSIAGTKW